jgi:hypothetical protein
MEQSKLVLTIILFLIFPIAWLSVKITEYLFKKLSTEKSTIIVLDRVKDNHKRTYKLALVFTNIVFLFFMIKIVYTILKFFHLIDHIGLLDHIDIVGFFVGGLGTILAFLITFYVENNHQKESKELQHAYPFEQPHHRSTKNL